MCKNKGIFYDLPLWDDFVSNLLYPAILGSLIYDLIKEIVNFNFDPTDFNQDNCIKFIFLLITSVFYVIDYFYMHYAFKVFKSDKVKKSIVKTEKVTSTRCMIWLDVLDTLSFAAIIIFVNQLRYDLIIFPIMLIYLIEANYLKDSEYKEICIKKQIVDFIFILIRVLIIYFIFYILNLDRYFNWLGDWSFAMIGYLILVFVYTILANEFYKDYPIKKE